MTKLQRVQGGNFFETQCSDHLHFTNKYIYDALSRIHCCSVKICRHAVTIYRQHRSMRSSSARYKNYRLVILIAASSVATIYSTCVCVCRPRAEGRAVCVESGGDCSGRYHWSLSHCHHHTHQILHYQTAHRKSVQCHMCSVVFALCIYAA